MGKNMYSLMLSEDVVAMVDRLAYAAGTNRSQLINSILAEYLSYRTPEMRMRDMFDQMEALLAEAEGFKVMLRNSDSLFSLRSALAYKYNPTIHYSVELNRAPGRDLGELRATLRTQNSELLLYIMQFYKLWAKLECQGPSGSEYSISPGKFVKKLELREAGSKAGQVSEDELSAAIVAYIRAFDTALKAFFYHLNEPQAAVSQVEIVYRDYAQNARILL